MWNWVVENWFPLWLAPNLVTLSGLMFIIASYILLAVYAPDLDGRDAPNWVHLFAGFSLLTYVNLDCMDGKQARRTQTSSPLGQLFDHGCDALSVMLILVSVCTSACLKLSPVMVVMMSGPLTVWILAQWEEYHTGMLHTVDKPHHSNTLGMLCACLLCCLFTVVYMIDCIACSTALHRVHEANMTGCRALLSAIERARSCV